MRFVLTTAILIGLAGPAAFAQTPPDAPQVSEAGIESVISEQLDAFNGRDLDSAFSHASPMIKGLFGTPGNFGAMVRQGYPMVWDNSAARFVATRQAQGRVFQQVMIQDATGTLHMLEYAMLQTDAGWKIDGVSLLPMPDVGV